MVIHAMKCGAGTARACKIAANASGPLESLAKPCSMKPKPTIRRNGIGAHRAIGNRPGKSNAMSCKDTFGLAVGLKIVFMLNLFRMDREVTRFRTSRRMLCAYLSDSVYRTCFA